MTVQVASHNFSAIGRMFARQNVPAVYGRQKAAASAETDSGAQAVDSVDLSPFAPKPLSGDMFSDALDAAKTMGGGGRLSTGQSEKLREDRVFSAISALAAMGEDGGESAMPRSWPAGLPAPTREELEEARRRLAQRLQYDGADANVEDMQRERVDLLRKIRDRDFAGFAVDAPNGLASTAAASTA